MDLKNLLNREQYEAAVQVDGPLLILAGAGSGKTRVLTHRIAYMINDLNISPYQILAITFTNKASGEMKERVRRIVGDTVDGMWISTFHSTCVRILRREIDKLGYNNNFTIYDSYDAKVLIKQCMKELNINEKDITDREIIGTISNAKNDLISADQFKRENESNFRKNKIADVYLLYTKKLKGNNSLDFDDLIFKTVELFKKNDDVLSFYQRKFRYIMVDEYQDTNECQYELVKMLANAHKNICVVGDDDQCIYEWRGANIKNILEFEKDFPSSKVVKLEQNYRSKGIILNAANEVIKNNANRKNKVLRTDKDSGEKIKIYRAFNERQEAEFVCREIKKMAIEEKKEYKDFAILYRMNSQSRTFEEAFRKAGLPYRILGGLKFYDRKEIKDIMAYLRLINNPLDDVSLKRIINVPKRAIGDSTVDKLIEFSNQTDQCLYNSVLDASFIPGLTSRAVSSINKFANLINEFILNKEDMTVSEIMKKIIEDTGYLKELEKSKDPEELSRVENIKELVSEAVDFEINNEDKSLESFLEKVTLVSDIDNYDEEADSIVMMTVHSAKGLEFPVVFMVGMENGIFPSEACFNKPEEMEEARRLCYVAITRAEEVLYMTSAENRMVFGRTMNYPQSDFIDEVSGTLKEIVNSGNGVNRGVNVLKSKTMAQKQNNNPHSLRYSLQNREVSVGKEIKSVDTTGLLPGKKVTHSKFGLGTLINLSGNIATIAFDNMGIKKLDISVAPIKPV